MKKIKFILVVLASVILLIFLFGCTPVSKDEEGVGIKINYYDKDGDLIGSSRLSRTSGAQSLISVPLDKIPLETVSIGFEVTISNTGDVPVSVTYTKADFVGEFE